MTSFWKDKKTLVTGGHGFVGHAVLGELSKLGRVHVIAPEKQELIKILQSIKSRRLSQTLLYTKCRENDRIGDIKK